MEVWKDIPKYKGFYQVSNMGNVQRDGRVLKNQNSNGYLSVGLSKYGIVKYFRVHQLVAMAFLNHKANTRKIVVNHKDFNKQNNKLENLEVISQRQNANLKHIKSSSKYVGVTWNKLARKWHSNMTINGKLKYLGCFINEYDAHIAYQKEIDKLDKVYSVYESK